jgi:hypothetical protein
MKFVDRSILLLGMKKKRETKSSSQSLPFMLKGNKWLELENSQV